MKTALVLISNGTEDIEMSTIVDVMRRGGVKVTLCAVATSEKMCTCANGLMVTADVSMKELLSSNENHSYDMLVVPGGGKGVEAFCSNSEAKALASWYFQNKAIGLICAGPLLLKAAGIANGYTITCYPTMKDEFAANYIHTCNENVVVDRNVITSQGPATAMEFALCLVKYLCGPSTYEKGCFKANKGSRMQGMIDTPNFLKLTGIMQSLSELSRNISRAAGRNNDVGSKMSLRPFCGARKRPKKRTSLPSTYPDSTAASLPSSKVIDCIKKFKSKLQLGLPTRDTGLVAIGVSVITVIQTSPNYYFIEGTIMDSLQRVRCLLIKTYLPSTIAVREGLQLSCTSYQVIADVYYCLSSTLSAFIWLQPNLIPSAHCCKTSSQQQGTRPSLGFHGQKGKRQKKASRPKANIAISGPNKKEGYNSQRRPHQIMQPDRNEKILHDFMLQGENNYCADCGHKGTRWASWNLGVFLCIKCSGIHRKLGTHISKIKSVTLDSWTDEQLEGMLTRGNEKMKHIYNAASSPFPQHARDMEQYIRNKYERRLFMTEREKQRLSQAEASALSTTSMHLPVDLTPHDRAKYQDRLKQLVDMGFMSPKANLQALKTCNGNLEEAIEYLVACGNSRSSPASTQHPTAQPSLSSLQHSLLDKLRGMGFRDEALNLRAMALHNWKLEHAINYIVAQDDVQPPKMAAPSPLLTLTPPPPYTRPGPSTGTGTFVFATASGRTPPTSTKNLLDSSSLTHLPQTTTPEVDLRLHSSSGASSSHEPDHAGTILDELSTLHIGLPTATVPSSKSTKDAILELFSQPASATSSLATGHEFSDFVRASQPGRPTSSLAINSSSSMPGSTVRPISQAATVFSASSRPVLGTSSADVTPTIDQPTGFFGVDQHHLRDSSVANVSRSAPSSTSNGSTTTASVLKSDDVVPSVVDPFAELAFDFSRRHIRPSSSSSTRHPDVAGPSPSSTVISPARSRTTPSSPDAPIN